MNNDPDNFDDLQRLGRAILGHIGVRRMEPRVSAREQFFSRTIHLDATDDRLNAGDDHMRAEPGRSGMVEYSGVDRVSSNPTGAETRLLYGYVRVLWRHRILVLSSVCAAFLLSLGLSLATRPKYEAITHIGVDLNRRDMLGYEKQNVSEGPDTISMRLETQLQIAQSDLVAEQVIRQLHLASNCTFSRLGCRMPIQDLDRLPRSRRTALLTAYHAGLRAQIVPRTQIMELRFRARDPQLAANIVNAVAAGYIDESFRNQLGSLQKASAWLNAQLDDTKKQAEAAQSRFAAYQQKVGIVGTDENHNVALNRVDELNRQLSTAESERIMKEARYRVAQSGDPELIGDASPGSLINTLRKQEADLRAQYSVLSSQYDEKYPRVVELARQLHDVQGSIDRQVNKIRNELAEQYDAARKSESMLKAALDQQEKEAMRVDASAVQYALLHEDVESSRALYESLVKKLKEASIDQGLRSSDLQLLDHAEVPSTPVSPRIPVNLTLGILSGLLIGIASVFLKEGLDHSIRTVEEIERLSSLPALAMIPRLSEGRTSRSRRIGGPSVVSRTRVSLPAAMVRPSLQGMEAYRAFRTVLLTCGRQKPRVICFVSGNGQEGKSTTSANTALVLAQQGKRVLLVDADLRRPTLHKYLHTQGDTGLSDALMDDTIEPSIDVIQESGLFFLPAGTANRPSYISESLGSARMKQLIRTWREEYDFVIIDTPPLLAFTDGVVTASLADTCVVVVRFTETSRHTLQYVRQLLERAKVRVSGVVLNDVDLNTLDHASYYDQQSYERYQQTTVD